MDLHMQKINKATQVAKKRALNVVKDRYRLAYHITAPSWLNDPNGLVEYKGEYHVFFQYHPYGENWGPMHWGHVKSKDLVHWEFLPPALAPSENYDKDGCFSGSAIVSEDEIILFYTGVVLEDHDEEKYKQVQCMAVSEDGINFSKIKQNPIISTPPKDGSFHFRDPKVWKHEENWYMVVGNSSNDKGRVLLYKSSDILNWAYQGVLDKNRDSDHNLGYMWECPDFFELDNKHVLLISPQGIDAVGDKYNNLHQTGYFIGDFNYENHCFQRTGQFQELDKGHDFYAVQTFKDSKSRRIAFGWMDMWESEMPTKADGWSGSLTVPRILSIKDNKELLMNPVPELKDLREDLIENLSDVDLSKEIELNSSGDSLEIIVEFDFESMESRDFGLRLKCSKDKTEEVKIGYQVDTKKLYLSREKAGRPDDPIRRSKIICSDYKLKLRIYLDRSSIEVFANDGLLVMSSRIYTNNDDNGIKLFSNHGQVKISTLSVWKLKDTWTKTMNDFKYS